MASPVPKLKKIEVARKLFNKHLPKVRAGTMTSTKFRAEVITGVMSESGAPMNSAATMYQLVRSEAEAAGELKGVMLGKKPKAPKAAKAPKKTAAAKKTAPKKTAAKKTAAKKTAPRSTTVAKKSAPKSSKPITKSSKASVRAATHEVSVTSDEGGNWIVGNGSTEYRFSSRERARTAKAKLGEGYSVTPPSKATAAEPAPAE